MVEHPGPLAASEEPVSLGLSSLPPNSKRTPFSGDATAARLWSRPLRFAELRAMLERKDGYAFDSPSYYRLSHVFALPLLSPGANDDNDLLVRPSGMCLTSLDEQAQHLEIAGS